MTAPIPPGAGVDRRRMLRGAVLAGGVVLYPGRARGARAALLGTGEGTTLDRTFRVGPPGTRGYRRIVVGGGEPHLLRDDLGGKAASGRAGRRRNILTFTQLTDVHLVDTQSPARVEFLDRLSDEDGILARIRPIPDGYRPQEPLTTQVAEAMVRAVNRVGRGPVTGARPAFTINTGDAADNTQLNEHRWMMDLLDGRAIRPDSGDPRRYEGVMAWGDRRYWQPEGGPDRLKSLHGFPAVPGLLDAARRPLDATGLRTPWLGVLGNHDGLMQGNIPLNPLLRTLATGTMKITAPVTGAERRELADVMRRGGGTALERMAGSRSRMFRRVTPDPRRRLLDRAEIVREHGPGHGFTAANRRDGTAFYAFDKGVVRGLVLDTCNPAGYAPGSLDAAQFAWLERELVAGSRRYAGRNGEIVRTGAADRLFVVFCHHTIATMDNPLGAGRIHGPAVEALLLRFPNVVLMVNGHTHRNEIAVHRRKGGVPGGFWEVSTAAHIDWPQQSRIIELVDNADGTLSVFATVIDTAAPHQGGRDTISRLASLSRELSANDPQAHPARATGAPEDRNVELLIPNPL